MMIGRSYRQAEAGNTAAGCYRGDFFVALDFFLQKY